MGLATIHEMIVDHNAFKRNLEVSIRMQHPDPLEIVIFCRIRTLNMTRLVIASNLKVTSVFAETHCELSLFNDSLLIHHIVDGLEPVQIHAGSHCAQT